MKTKSKSPHGAAAKPSVSTLTLPLDEQHTYLLAACAAYDGQTPEAFARDALRSALACAAEAIGHELKQAG